MSDSHDLILDAFFWKYVDGGILPDATPLFSGLEEGRLLIEIVSQRYGLSLEKAFRAIEAARQEVAL